MEEVGHVRRITARSLEPRRPTIPRRLHQHVPTVAPIRPLVLRRQLRTTGLRCVVRTVRRLRTWLLRVVLAHSSPTEGQVPRPFGSPTPTDTPCLLSHELTIQLPDAAVVRVDSSYNTYFYAISLYDRPVLVSTNSHTRSLATLYSTVDYGYGYGCHVGRSTTDCNFFVSHVVRNGHTHFFRYSYTNFSSVCVPSWRNDGTRYTFTC